MAQGNDKKELIKQNLIDAGCNEETTEKCMMFFSADKTDEMIQILRCYRSQLLGDIRNRQKQLDCLDYLLFQINKQR